MFQDVLKLTFKRNTDYGYYMIMITYLNLIYCIGTFLLSVSYHFASPTDNTIARDNQSSRDGVRLSYSNIGK